jgi:cellulose 1,4-beta-cellobiosidase
VTSPYTHSDLLGTPYYYTVTAVNSYGESSRSIEASATPLAPPPAPTGISATARYVYNGSIGYSVIDVTWNAIPEVNYYNLYRCQAGWLLSTDPPEVADCTPGWLIYSDAEVLYSDADVNSGAAYRYRVTAVNDFGESAPSENIGIGAAIN